MLLEGEVQCSSRRRKEQHKQCDAKVEWRDRVATPAAVFFACTFSRTEQKEEVAVFSDSSCSPFIFFLKAKVLVETSGL